MRANPQTTIEVSLTMASVKTHLWLPTPPIFMLAMKTGSVVRAMLHS